MPELNFTFTRSGNTFTAYINGVNQNPNTGNTLGTLTSSETSFLTPNNIGSDQICLEMSAPNRAGIILPLDGQEENEDTLMLVMPVMLN